MTTGIEWTDETWNPTRGCSLVSPGCRSCYAMKQAHRFSGKGRAYEGLTKTGNTGPVWTGEVRLIESMLEQPLHWKQPKKIFVNSMSDLFHEALNFGQIARVFGVMARCPQHTFQILTKRAARMQQFFDSASARIHAMPFEEGVPLPNVWLGVSVEDQKRADERIPHLLRTPAAVRFLSCEPLLGPVDLRIAKPAAESMIEAMRAKLLHWCIVGGESGGGARPMAIEWARDLVNQCTDARVPVFVKQMGTRPLYGIAINGGPAPWRLRSDSKGGDPKDWPGGAAAWPREFPLSPKTGGAP